MAAVRRRAPHQRLVAALSRTPLRNLIFHLEISGKNVPEMREKVIGGPSTQIPEIPLTTSPPSSSSSSTNPATAIVLMLLAFHLHAV